MRKHLNPRKRIPIRDRFFKYVKKTKDCWYWKGAIDPTGYGATDNGGWPSKKESAHRMSWFFRYGLIPGKLCVLHTCDVRNCVNPEHLWLGTRKDNALDCIKKGRKFITHGERSGQAKLTNKKVYEIRKSYTPRKTSTRYLAEKYGVQHHTIWLIVTKQTWKHLL